MAKEKQPNYTPEQEHEIRDFYQDLLDAGADYDTRQAAIEAYAVENGRKPRSIVSKLARMDSGDFYVKKVTVSKVSGETAEKKSELSVEVAAAVNMFVDNPKRKVNAENLEKLNKLDLLGLRDAFTVLAPDSPESD